MKVAAKDPRWKVSAKDDDVTDLLDEFEEVLPLRELHSLAKKIEDKVEELPGHGGRANYYARDITQMLENMETVLKELRDLVG